MADIAKSGHALPLGHARRRAAVLGVDGGGHHRRGALEWRPHLLLTAPAAQGKTWLLKNVLERLMGPMLTSISDATPAAIAKVTQYASLPIAIDEAEPSEEWVLGTAENIAGGVI